VSKRHFRFYCVDTIWAHAFPNNFILYKLSKKFNEHLIQNLINFKCRLFQYDFLMEICNILTIIHTRVLPENMIWMNKWDILIHLITLPNMILYFFETQRFLRFSSNSGSWDNRQCIFKNTENIFQKTPQDILRKPKNAYQRTIFLICCIICFTHCSYEFFDNWVILYFYFGWTY
jgi:hypothetical protein